MIGLLVLGTMVIGEPVPQPVGMPVRVDAEPGAAYLAKCHIRTFMTPDRVYANTYYIDSHGPFHDRIPSPNAQCIFGKVKGPGPVTLHIYKGGDHALRVDRPNQWLRLLVW